MKRIKSILALGLCCLLTLSLTSCGNPYSGVNFDEYIEVGEYKGLATEKISVSVTDSEVTSEIDSRRQAAAETKSVTEGTVKSGDTVNIDYVGSIDGAKFEGGEAEGYNLTIGSGTFIDGFEDQLIGMKVGTTKNIKVKFPDDYSKAELAGKNAIFAVKVNSLEKQVVPELNDEFAKKDSDGEAKTVKEYKEFIKKYLTEQKTIQKEVAQRTDLWNKVVDNSKIKTDDKGNGKYPEEQLQATIDQYTKMYEEYAGASSITLEEFVQQNFGMDMDTFNKQLDELAKIVVKEEMIEYYIADKEGIKVSKDDKEAYVNDLLAQYGYTQESFEEANGESYEEVEGKENIEKAALKEKVQKFIVENAKVK